MQFDMSSLIHCGAFKIRTANISVYTTEWMNLLKYQKLLMKF